MTFDDLVKEAAETPKLPSGFVQSVQRRIGFQEAKQRRYALVRDAVTLSGALLLFFYSLSLLLVNTYSFETIDFLSLAFAEPSLLALEDGRLAVFDALPLMSALLTALSLGICFFLLRLFLRDVAPSHPTLFHRHAYS